MKISRDWLQTFFESPLPEAQIIADALTFHAFEIESVENDLLDVKVTPNRGHDCLSHEGIAREVAAILKMPLKHASERETDFATTNTVKVAIENPALCRRYIAAHIRGVKVEPSPDWLRDRLESIGQRSINNIVDAANFVMFNMGQPLHVFDAQKISILSPKSEQGSTLYDKVEPCRMIEVRYAREGEALMTLDEKEQKLPSSTLLIADGGSGTPLGIAGIKGGKDSGVSEMTTDIILEAATFDGPTLRKTARALKFKTDATQRFEQVLSPVLAERGMRAFIELVLQVAGGELVGVVDEYPRPQEQTTVSISLEKINGTLGVTLPEKEIAGVFTRLGLPFTLQDSSFVVTVPPERLDIVIAEDLIEEVARIVGYDAVPATPLPVFTGEVVRNKNFEQWERVRAALVAEGFSECFTSVFAEKGERAVSNKIGGDRPYLRTTLKDGLRDALERNMRNKDLLGVKQVKLFEIGSVWHGGGEKIEIEIAVEKVKKMPTEEEYQRQLATHSFQGTAQEGQPTASSQQPTAPVRYKPFSKYPFIVRDIALWVSEGTSGEDVLSVIRTHAGELLVRCEKFDEFTKEGRTSFAFRLVFQSFDTTLTDEDANSRMESVYKAVQTKGWEVR